MCANHRLWFNKYLFFLRFIPEIRKFVFITCSNHPYIAEFHGRAVALDINDQYAPFTSLLILHEMRARGFHPFQPANPEAGDSRWQDWVYSDGVFDVSSGSFKRDSPPYDEHTVNDGFSTRLQLQSNPTMIGEGGASSGGHVVTMNAGVVADILAATRASLSWKACQVEGMSWTGTAQDNINKYASTIGVEEDSALISSTSVVHMAVFALVDSSDTVPNHSATSHSTSPLSRVGKHNN